MYVKRPAARAPEPVPVGGDAIAHALIGTYRRIQDPTRWTADAYARDRDGEWLRAVGDVKTRAFSYSLLAALDVGCGDLDVQAAACDVLRRVCDAAGVHQSLSAFGRSEGHQRTLALLAEAIRWARAETWDRSRTPALPDRPPSETEYLSLCLEHQLIEEIHFGSDPCAGQFDSTWSICDEVAARHDAIDAYLEQHASAVDAIEARIARRERWLARAAAIAKPRRRLIATARRLARRSARSVRRRRWARRPNRAADDIPF
jgi:hypothetical protein